MPFKVLSVFANAGLHTDDEIYVVVEVNQSNSAREIYSLKQSELYDGQDAQSLKTAFTLAWDSVRAQRHNDSWQLQVKRYPEFDGGCSGWENADCVYGDQADLDVALEERRGRHALYLLAINPVYVQAAFERATALPVAREVVYKDATSRRSVKAPLTMSAAPV